MPRSIDKKNRQARQVNPLRSGVRTGNPQLESHDAGEVLSSPRQRPKRRPGAAPLKPPRRRAD